MLETTSPVRSPFRVNEHEQGGVELSVKVKKEERLRGETERLWKWCGSVLLEFSRKPEALRFLEPVDWVKLGIPLYPNIIRRPMDLGTIKGKLERRRYSSIFDFDKEVRLV